MGIGKFITGAAGTGAGAAVGISALTHASMIFGETSLIAHYAGMLTEAAFGFAPGLMGSANVIFGSTIASGYSVAAGQGWLLATLGGGFAGAIATVALAGVAIWGVSKLCNWIGTKIDNSIDHAKARAQMQRAQSQQQNLQQGHEVAPQQTRTQSVSYEGPNHPGYGKPEGYHQQQQQQRQLGPGTQQPVYGTPN